MPFLERTLEYDIPFSIKSNASRLFTMSGCVGVGVWMDALGRTASTRCCLSWADCDDWLVNSLATVRPATEEVAIPRANPRVLRYQHCSREKSCINMLNKVIRP